MSYQQLTNNKKKEVILSGFVRYRLCNHTYYLHINSRILGNNLLELNHKELVKVYRKDDSFLVRKDSNGNVLRGDRRGPLVCISKKLINKKEQDYLSSPDTKYSMPKKVILNPNELNLKKI